MEWVLEVLFDLILDGSLEIVDAESKKVPRALRILAAFILLAFCVLYTGFCVFLAANGIKQEQPLLLVLSVVLALILAVAVIYKVSKIAKKRNG